MYIPRGLQDQILKSKKSILLLGPRQVGKSTLIKQLKPELTINLSDETLFISLSSDLQHFKDLVEKKNYKTIFIDEIQRLPQLLNLVQYYIDQDKKMKFYLTGSSARKLSRGGANLLPGRVLNFYLGPLTAREVGYSFNTEDILSFGSLPEVCGQTEKQLRKDSLRSYSVGYLKEEIQAEALVRDLSSFVRFFQTITQSVGQSIDYSKLAKRAKISRHSVPRYFEIIEDTLIGTRLDPFQKCSEEADLIKHPRFYLFDNGVYNGLVGNFVASSDRRGMLMEQLVLNQVTASCWAFNKMFSSSTFRTRGGLEIDFIFEIEGEIFPIEVKSSDAIQNDDTRSLKDFKRYYSKPYSPFIFHGAKKEFKREGIWCLPWQDGLRKLGL